MCGPGQSKKSSQLLDLGLINIIPTFQRLSGIVLGIMIMQQSNLIIK
jgi:hypothetical protein